ncbi:MAG: ABC transporter ATP-binding protein [Chloroflexi bacterium]|nr:ABC transporter ATP-binding protein [Chloroflexota bacterium]
MTTLSLIDLTKEYVPGVTAVADLNLTIREGELMALLGPSGCGKTTTLRLISGLTTPTHGDVRFDGQSVLQTSPEKRGTVMVFQKDALFSFMSVGENVAFGLKMQKLAPQIIQERVAGALTAVQLPNFESRQPDQLSGGQRQRVALARALVIRPRLLLLDEPLSNLDRELREDLRHMIRDLVKEAGITTLFVTHDQAEAVTIADRIGLMIDGRLCQVDVPQAFYERPADAQVARFFGASNFIPGLKRGRQIETQLGNLEVTPSPLTDGPVLLTIRPEAIEVGDNGHNNLAAQVQQCHYRGQSVQYQVTVNGICLDMVTTPFNNYQEGDHIVLHLPRERICLLPA